MLSPNARPHWGALNRVRKIYRHQCAVLAFTAGAKLFGLGKTTLNVHLEFIPPNRRARDQDNVIASCKALYDGLADAMGVDDCHFRLSHTFRNGTGGIVKVTVTDAS